MVRLERSRVVVGFDFDFTLGEFKRENALTAVVEGVSLLSPLAGVNVRKHLEDRVYRMIQGDGALIGEVRRTFNRHVAQRHGHRLEESTWSLFARLCLLLAERGARPEAHYQLLTALEDRFWHHVSQDSVLFGGVDEMLKWLRGGSIPTFVLTSSDARLLYEATTNRVIYDVAHSIGCKRERIARMGIVCGDLVDHVIPSDPFSKEDVSAWKNLVFPRFPERTDPSQWVFVGDAPYDMEGAHSAGVETRIFIHRHGHSVPPEATHDVESIAELRMLLHDLIGP